MGEVFDCDPDAIGPATSMDTLEAWDSMAHLNLVLALEETLGVRFSTDDVPNMRSFDRIVATLERQASE